MDTKIRISLIDFLPQAIYEFLIVWFIDASSAILKTTYAGVVIVSDMFALPVLFKTFFVPWRAEDRKGFIAIAIGIAVTIRIFAIISALFTILLVVAVGLLVLFIWALIPLVFTAMFFFGLAKLLLPI